MAVPLTWVDQSVNAPYDDAPWMLVTLREVLPLTCQAGRDRRVAITGARINAEGQGFRTVAPLAKTDATGDVFAWQLMPLPAGTERLTGVLDLDVRSCRGSDAVLTKDVLRVEAAAPPEYLPPTVVPAVRAAGVWTFGQYDPGTLAFYRPLDIGVGGFQASYGLGSTVSLSVSIKNNAADLLTLTRPLVLRAHIGAAGMHGARIWEATLPPLLGTLGGREGYAQIKFHWDQHDGAGRQIPPGVYYAALDLPIDAHFTLGGQAGRQPLKEATPARSFSFVVR